MLSIKGLAVVGAVLWGGGFFLVALGNLIFPDYGSSLLNLGASIYPGYHGPDGVGSVVVAALYATVDGAVAGAIAAWVYNKATAGEIRT